jgi:hypothetical protein
MYIDIYKHKYIHAGAGFGMMPGMWNPMTMMNAMGGPAAMVSAILPVYV